MHGGGRAVQKTATGDISAETVTIQGLTLTGTAATTAVIKEGGAGGTEVLALACPANDHRSFEVPFAIKAPHVTLTGAGVKLTVVM